MSQAMYFEDITEGTRIETGGINVTEAHIVGFAGLAGDFFGLHMDDQFARELGFPRRVAHGLLCLALVDGLKNRAEEQFAAVASLNWNWNFRAPVFAGDRISAAVEVTQIRPTSDGSRGLVTLRFEVRNQDGAIVQDGTNLLLVRTRGAAPARDPSPAPGNR